jgi:hypothetical protein
MQHLVRDIQLQHTDSLLNAEVSHNCDFRKDQQDIL